MEINLPNMWEPRPDQIRLWSYLEHGGGRAVEVAHRRWGKDDVSLHHTACKAMERVGNYWHMLPKYSQARKAIWDAINPQTGKKRIDEAFPREIRSNTRKQDMAIEFINGSMWQLVGSDNYDSYVGSPPCGVAFSEWAISNPLAWGFISPILEQNNGWAIFIYTSRGNNHGKTMHDHAKKTPGWFCEKLPASQTNVFRPEQLESIRNEYINLYGEELGEAMYLQEYECSWGGATFGAYLAKQITRARESGRVTKVPHNPSIEVDTAWDLGIDDSMSIWFIQPVGKS